MTERTPKLDPEALRTFVTVAQLRSFSAAADVLHKTTSAISYRIKSLEDSMGTPLFQRTTRSVSLTAAGEILLEKASQIFEWLHTLPEELKQVHDGIEPHFTLVVNNILYDARALGGLLADLHRRFPHAALKVRRAVYMGVWDEMLHGGGNVALGVPGFHTINDDFATLPLGIVNWVFVVAPSHPLASAPGPLTSDVLRRYPAVNVEDTSVRLTKRTAWRLPGQQELLVPDLHAKVACHIQGLGVGFLPAATVREQVRARLLVERPVKVGRSPSPLALAWRRPSEGRITRHLRSLCEDRDPLILPFLAPLDPVEPRTDA
ncbi:MAG TPA: HTH-type transcriptional activator AllS [Casimicrobiaceae bacterium]|nr:HTH-type transcriptional activator AllS [Casimicrobiaceae bacterium]